MDQMRSMDKNGSGYIKNENFMKNILNSKFRTSEKEMKKVIVQYYCFVLLKVQVVRLFDINDDGRIDYYEFISSLHPRDSYKPQNDADKIEDEVIREVTQCRCCDRFQIQQVGENKYKVYQVICGQLII